MKKGKFPGQSYTFLSRKTKETDTGILPGVYGEGNEFAIWHILPGYKNGGTWRSRKFARKRLREFAHGDGPSGLWGRMNTIFRNFKYVAEKGGYKPPTSTPEQMMAEWIAQDGKCAACKGPISLYGTVKDRGASYDHNHETGEPRGFVHSHCNTAEGSLLLMTNEEFANYIEWIIRTHNRKI